VIERTVLDPDDWSDFDQALFVRQLKEAGISQDRVARRAFFNAEVMTRDVQEREVRSELHALDAVRAQLHQMWHTRFEAERAERDEATTALPGLYPGVMVAVEAHHQGAPRRRFGTPWYIAPASCITSSRPDMLAGCGTSTGSRRNIEVAQVNDLSPASRPPEADPSFRRGQLRAAFDFRDAADYRSDWLLGILRRQSPSRHP
jgi:hypothetical protein